MATIKPIEGRSVHQIQSGQVIVDLCSVVKELVENALDADATSLQVYFKNNGLDNIEVIDNGKGIAPDDYETVALKHYTSKLSNYADLTGLTTFGFRGEALSSLCALSKFHIVTAQQGDGPKGTRLDFEISGKLKDTSVMASQKGTSVTVQNLFYNLPVRRRELEKNIKREYGKVIGLLHAYACISTGVKFAVSKQGAKGQKEVVFSTRANTSTRENIINVYGAKTMTALIPLDLNLEMQPSMLPSQTARSWAPQSDINSRSVRIQGHISRPVIGEGRQTPDRQMFFVNSRPCGLPQVAKAFNEVYKSYNVMQSPFIFADIRLDTNAYDVNVSPDKRTILLHDQTTLLDKVKEELTKLFENHEQSVPRGEVVQKLPGYKQLMVNRDNAALLRRSSSKEQTVAATTDGADEEAEEASSPEPDSTPSCRAEVIPGGLVSNFAARNSEARHEQRSPSAAVLNSLTKDKQNLVAKLEKSKINRASSTHVDRDDLEGENPEELPEAEETFMPDVPRPVQDFNAAMGHSPLQQRSSPPATPATAPKVEIPIAAIVQTPLKSTPGPVQNAFDRMRPKRTPQQDVEVTIGDHTTIMTMGSTPKKRRIHTPKFDEKGNRINLTPRPLLGKLKGFAAPGTQISSSAEEETEEVGEDEDTQIDVEKPLHDSAQQRDTEAHPEAEDLDSSEAEGDDIDNVTTELRDPGVQAWGSDADDLGLNQTKPSQKKRAFSPLFVPEAEPEEVEAEEEDNSDGEYLDEAAKKAKEDARVARMIAEAEATAAKPSDDNVKRATKVLKGSRRNRSTLELVQYADTSVEDIRRKLRKLSHECNDAEQVAKLLTNNAELLENQTQQSAEERLSLTVSKADFARMRIVGQFNLGFILAVRPATGSSSALSSSSDELFIIDQHASAEKFNFERLQATTIMQTQRMVNAYTLNLTAVEEEVIFAHEEALTANGFRLDYDTSGDVEVGKRCRLVGLPMSKEVVFNPSDLEELIHLLSDYSLNTGASKTTIPRPSKTRKMFAMRACRSSVMIGKTLTMGQMRGIVRDMGSLDKPWNCPHGRPTMRHLYGLQEWRGSEDNGGGDGDGERTDWAGYLRRNRKR